MLKWSQMLVLSASALAFGCSDPVRNDAVTSRSGAGTPSGFKIEATVTPGAELSATSGYWRVRGDLVSPSNNAIAFNGTSWQQFVHDELAKAGIWSSNTDYVLTARVVGLSEPTPAYDLIAIDGSGAAVDVKADSPTFWLMTPSLNLSIINVCVMGVKTQSTQTHVASDVASAATLAAPLFGGAVLLTPPAQAQVSSAANAIDSAISKGLTGTARPPPMCLPFTPFADGNNLPAASMSVFYEGNGQRIPLVSFSNEHLDTLLVSTHRYVHVRAIAYDILHAALATDDASKTSTPDALLNNTASVNILRNSPSSQTTQAFCRSIETDMSNRSLVLSDADRAAIIWAYLQGSPWSSPKGRPASEDDACLPLLAPLDNAMPQLHYKLAPREAASDSSAIQAAEKNLKEKGLPSALGAGLVNPDLATRKKLWLAVLADSVTLTAVGRSIGTSSDVIPAGSSRDLMSKDNAADILSKLSTTWTPASPCEPPVADASALFIDISAACVGLTESPDTKSIPMGMTVKIDSQSNPLISRVWFFDEHAQRFYASQ